MNRSICDDGGSAAPSKNTGQPSGQLSSGGQEGTVHMVRTENAIRDLEPERAEASCIAERAQVGTTRALSLVSVCWRMPKWPRHTRLPPCVQNRLCECRGVSGGGPALESKKGSNLVGRFPPSHPPLPLRSARLSPGLLSTRTKRPLA